MKKVNLRHSILDGFANLLQENRCSICYNSSNFSPISKDSICKKCLNDLNCLKIIDNLNSNCAVCKNKITANGALSSCSICKLIFKNKLSLSSIYSYQDIAITLLSSLKYKQDPALALRISQLLMENFLTYNNFFQIQTPIILIPAPSHPDSIRQRGFYSNYYVSRCFAKLSNLEIKEFLCLDTALNSQTKKNPKERLKHGLANFKPKYPLNINFKKNYSFLIIDDVITTGRTSLGIGKYLIDKYGGRVHILTLARSANYSKFCLQILTNLITNETRFY